MSRRELSLPVMRPKVEFVGLTSAPFQLAWFRKLKISARNCTFFVPPTFTFLNSAMSHWYWPGL